MVSCQQASINLKTLERKTNITVDATWWAHSNDCDHRVVWIVRVCLQEVLVNQRTALGDMLQQLLKQKDQREMELRQVLVRDPFKKALSTVPEYERLQSSSTTVVFCRWRWRRSPTPPSRTIGWFNTRGCWMPSRCLCGCRYGHHVGSKRLNFNDGCFNETLTPKLGADLSFTVKKSFPVRRS